VEDPKPLKKEGGGKEDPKVFGFGFVSFLPSGLLGD
jgi:hypothetical protein